MFTNDRLYNAGEKLGYENHFCLCITENQAQQELRNQDVSIVVLHVLMLQLRHRTGSSTVFSATFSEVVKHRLFCSWRKRQNGEGERLLWRLWLQARPSKPDGYGSHGNCSLGPKGELGRGWGWPENSNTPDTCARTDDAWGWDVMEVSDKTVEIRSPGWACVHMQGWDLQASTSLLMRDRRLL